MSILFPEPSNTFSSLNSISTSSEYCTVITDVPSRALERRSGSVSSMNGWAWACATSARASTAASTSFTGRVLSVQI